MLEEITKGHIIQLPSPSNISFQVSSSYSWPCPVTFWKSPIMKISQALWQCALNHFHGEFRYVNKKLEVSLAATYNCCFLTLCWESLLRVWLCLAYNLVLDSNQISLYLSPLLGHLWKKGFVKVSHFRNIKITQFEIPFQTFDYHLQPIH